MEGFYDTMGSLNKSSDDSSSSSASYFSTSESESGSGSSYSSSSSGSDSEAEESEVEGEVDGELQGDLEQPIHSFGKGEFSHTTAMIPVRSSTVVPAGSDGVRSGHGGSEGEWYWEGDEEWEEEVESAGELKDIDPITSASAKRRHQKGNYSGSDTGSGESYESYESESETSADTRYSLVSSEDYEVAYGVYESELTTVTFFNLDYMVDTRGNVFSHGVDDFEFAGGLLTLSFVYRSLSSNFCLSLIIRRYRNHTRRWHLR